MIEYRLNFEWKHGMWITVPMHRNGTVPPYRNNNQSLKMVEILDTLNRRLSHPLYPVWVLIEVVAPIRLPASMASRPGGSNTSR